MREAVFDQFPDNIRHAACSREAINIARTVGIDARDQRHGAAEFVHVVPVDLHTGSARDGREVDNMVGRTARGEQPDDGIDDGVFIDANAKRPVVITVPADLGDALDRGAGQFLAQFGAGGNEAGARHVQAHHFHHHLVGISGAIERAGARRMIAGALAFKQLVTPDFAFCKELADALLFLVGQARWHLAGGHKNCRQVAEAQASNEQARHDLVTNAKQQRGLIHTVTEADSGAHGDVVAAEQREFHRALALRHPVAHRRNAARDLRCGANFAGENLDLFGVATIGLMRRKHVVVGGYDPDIARPPAAQGGLVLICRGKAVREIAAGKHITIDAGIACTGDQVEIGCAGRPRALGDPIGNFGNGLM